MSGFAAFLIAGLAPDHARSHDFGVGRDGYEDFLFGNLAVLIDTPVVLGMAATGLFVGIWKSDGLPQVWLFYIAGMFGGAVIGLFGIVPLALPAYAAVFLVGLLGAAALDLSLAMVRVIVGLIGMVLANAILSGHSIGEVRPFSYFGIAFALNMGLSFSAALVAISRENLPYGWVLIAWRAAASWLVAISVMAAVLMYRYPV